ncbi:AIPR family protein [Cystobacter fuscus]
MFLLKGASVVNGAQTISSIGRVADDTALSRVRVPIRVISLQGASEEFGREVTRSNNLQNRVEGRDFVAQDPEQERIRQEMAMEGYEYRFVRGQNETVSSSSCDLLEVTTALACASGDLSLAVQAKSGIGQFFVDLKKLHTRRFSTKPQLVLTHSMPH